MQLADIFNALINSLVSGNQIPWDTWFEGSKGRYVKTIERIILSNEEQMYFDHQNWYGIAFPVTELYFGFAIFTKHLQYIQNIFTIHYIFTIHSPLGMYCKLSPLAWLWIEFLGGGYNIVFSLTYIIPGSIGPLYTCGRTRNGPSGNTWSEQCDRSLPECFHPLLNPCLLLVQEEPVGLPGRASWMVMIIAKSSGLCLV